MRLALVVPLDGEPYIEDEQGLAGWLIQAALYAAAAGYMTEWEMAPAEEGDE